MLVSERLKYARKACGLTQGQVASVLGIDRSAYTYYETGKSNPSIGNLLRLAAIFKTDVAWLIGGQPQGETLASGEDVFDMLIDIEQRNMTELSKEERAVVAFYRMLKKTSDEQKLTEALRTLRDSTVYDEEE